MEISNLIFFLCFERWNFLSSKKNKNPLLKNFLCRRKRNLFALNLKASYISVDEGRKGGGALAAKIQNNKGKKSDLKKFLTFLKKMFFSHFWMTADQTVK